MPRRRKKRSAWASIAQVDATTFRIRYWAAGPDGYKRRSKTVRGTRMDAERVRSELMLQHSEDAPCPTVGEAWEQWVLPDLERRVDGGTLAASSLRQYRSAWNRHIAPTWADVPCDAVRPLKVQQWLDTLGSSAASQGVKVLGAVMDAAVRYECVDHNPMRERYVMPSKTTIRSHDAGIWTASELGALWSGLRGEWHEPAFILAGLGGLRVGESLGVTAADVQLRDVSGVPVALVAVQRQVDRHGEVTERLKTEQSRRVAFVVGKAALRLSEIAESMPSDWYLAHDGMGAPQPQRRLNASWKGDHPFRNLRNSWQTWMRWEMGVAPWAIEIAMGHAGAGVTARYYDRPTDDVVAQVIVDAYLQRPYDATWDDLGLA